MDCLHSIEPWRSLSVIFILILWAWAQKSEREDDYRRPTDSQNNTEDKQGDIARAAGFGSEGRLVDNPQNAPQKQHWYRKKDNWKEIREWATFLGVAAATIIYFRQMKANEGQVIEAERQLGQGQTNAMIDERAWLLPSFNTVTASRWTDGGATFFVEFSNSGKTPAKNVQTYGTSWMGSDDALTNKDVFPDTGVTKGLIPPNGSDHAACQVQAIQIAMLQTKRNRLWIFGAVKYDDIFGYSHLSQFCYEISPDLVSGPSTSRFHNAIDDIKP